MMSGVHSSPILRSCGGCSPIGGSRFSRGFEVVDSLEIPSILCLLTSNLQNPAFLLDVLHISLAYKVFLDHPQNYRVCWRGSCPSPVRVSDKQNMQK
jgi:hypothetical protein